MLAKIGRLFVALAGLIIAGAFLFNLWSTNKANSIKDEGNAAIDAANKLIDQSSAKFSALLSDENKAGFPANRKELEAAAKECADLFKQTAEQFRLAKSKFTEAAEKITEKHVVDYWKLHAEELENRALVQDAKREFAALFADPKIENWAQLDDAADGFLTRINAATEAADKAVADAKKIQDDYPNSFAK